MIISIAVLVTLFLRFAVCFLYYGYCRLSAAAAISST